MNFIVRSITAAIFGCVLLVDFSEAEIGFSVGHSEIATEQTISKAAYIGRDDRVPLTEFAKGGKLSSVERERAMRCTGVLICEGPEYMRLSAGAVCPPTARSPKGICNADRIATAAHGFIRKASPSSYRDVKRCYFQNYRGHRTSVVESDARSVDAATFYDADGKLNTRKDKVVLRLQKHIPHCDAYDVIGDEAAAPRAGQSVIAITGKQADQTMKQSDGMEPVAHECRLMKWHTSSKGMSGVYRTDCDANGGASGGFLLTTDAARKLVVVAIIAGSSLDPSKNGQDYHEEANPTLAVTTTADFLLMLANPGTGLR